MKPRPVSIRFVVGLEHSMVTVTPPEGAASVFEAADSDQCVAFALNLVRSHPEWRIEPVKWPRQPGASEKRRREQGAAALSSNLRER
jgi:hypothetical protein